MEKVPSHRTEATAAAAGIPPADVRGNATADKLAKEALSAHPRDAEAEEQYAKTDERARPIRKLNDYLVFV